MKRARSLLAPLSILLLVCPACASADEPAASPKLSRDQQLIVAAFELDVAKVKSLLADGANVNARMGKHPRNLFQDKWSLGWPVASPKWTPLIAVANSHREPQPAETTENTTAALDEAEEKRSKIDPKIIAERDSRRVAIAKLLIAAMADLDLDDGYGATALASAVYEKADDLALMLIEAGAKVDTKTGIYIDGTGDITPLHQATDRPQLVKGLLKHGADASALDGTGQSALHWAVRDAEVESVRLLIEAGADVNAKDKKGRTPLSHVRFVDPSSPAIQDAKLDRLLKNLFPDREKMKQVDALLRKAGAK
jgi:hypothetical protein